MFDLELVSMSALLQQGVGGRPPVTLGKVMNPRDRRLRFLLEVSIEVRAVRVALRINTPKFGYSTLNKYSGRISFKRVKRHTMLHIPVI